ncbi:hypothetical protein KY308_03640 [Candidatus Woesearchaeota archaeon]|nr:hypothetical protein [Candidatus Woesearchaeota archaeon]
MTLKAGIIHFTSALLVKVIVYFIMSLIFVYLFLWAGVIEKFNVKLAVVITIILLFLRIFISEIFIKSEQPAHKPGKK